jgi:hypothetical protein
MPSYYIQPWREALRQGSFRLHVILTLAALVVTLMALTRFLAVVEARAGVVLNDPVLFLIDPRDVTWLTFSLIYGGLVFAVGLLARTPARLFATLQAYVVLVIIRMACMWLVPLEPPAALIPLKDPFVEFFGGMKTTLNKDLFFSGHTSTLFLLFLCAGNRPTKYVFLLCTLAVACCVLLQHAHYTIDVVAALFFAYGAYRIVLHAGPDGAALRNPSA